MQTTQTHRDFVGNQAIYLHFSYGTKEGQQNCSYSTVPMYFVFYTVAS